LVATALPFTADDEQAARAAALERIAREDWHSPDGWEVYLRLPVLYDGGSAGG